MTRDRPMLSSAGRPVDKVMYLTKSKVLGCCGCNINTQAGSRQRQPCSPSRARYAAIDWAQFKLLHDECLSLKPLLWVMYDMHRAACFRDLVNRICAPSVIPSPGGTTIYVAQHSIRIYPAYVYVHHEAASGVRPDGCCQPQFSRGAVYVYFPASLVLSQAQSVATKRALSRKFT